MKTIIPFNNTPTIVHVSKLPPLTNPSLDFGFNIGSDGGTPILQVNIIFTVTGNGTSPISIATYNSHYKITGEGLIVEEHIFDCCRQAVYAMKKFLQLQEIGRAIPDESIQCPGKEAFEGDLIHLAKALNAIEGKRGFPSA